MRDESQYLPVVTKCVLFIFILFRHVRWRSQIIVQHTPARNSSLKNYIRVSDNNQPDAYGYEDVIVRNERWNYQVAAVTAGYIYGYIWRVNTHGRVGTRYSWTFYCMIVNLLINSSGNYWNKNVFLIRLSYTNTCNFVRLRVGKNTVDTCKKWINEKKKTLVQ
jgi:hypothetical protein